MGRAWRGLAGVPGDTHWSPAELAHVNYFGQGALLLELGRPVAHPLYHLVSAAVLPWMVVLATAAAIIASPLEQQAETRHKIEAAIVQQFAPEDEGLRFALSAAKKAGLPEIQISPIQGKFLQLLAAACHARKILEIGSLGGYSGIWLARSLPPGGRLITLEINPTHAQ